MDTIVEFENCDISEEMRFIHIVGGCELVVKSGLSRLMPKWLRVREDLISVGGTKYRDPKWGRDSSKEVFKHEVKKVVATVIEILVNTVMSTHIFSKWIAVR